MKQKPNPVINQPSTAPKVYNPVQPPPAPNPVAQDLNSKLVPIQLTLPAPQGSQDTQPRVLSIQVPASALAS